MKTKKFHIKRGRKTRVRGGDPQMEKLAQIYNEFSKKKEIDSSPDTQSKLVDMIDGILKLKPESNKNSFNDVRYVIQRKFKKHCIANPGSNSLGCNQPYQDLIDSTKSGTIFGTLKRFSLRHKTLRPFYLNLVILAKIYNFAINDQPIKGISPDLEERIPKIKEIVLKLFFGSNGVETRGGKSQMRGGNRSQMRGGNPQIQDEQFVKLDAETELLTDSMDELYDKRIDPETTTQHEKLKEIIGPEKECLNETEIQFLRNILKRNTGIKTGGNDGSTDPIVLLSLACGSIVYYTIKYSIQIALYALSVPFYVNAVINDYLFSTDDVWHMQYIAKPGRTLRKDFRHYKEELDNPHNLFSIKDPDGNIITGHMIGKRKPNIWDFFKP